MLVYIALTAPELMNSSGTCPKGNAYFAAQDGDLLPAFFHDLYKVAAAVDTTNLDELFHMTNTIEQLWTLNNGVTPLSTIKKSMPMGDLAVDVENDKVWLCDSIGWVDITDESLKLIATTKALIALALNTKRPASLAA